MDSTKNELIRLEKRMGDPNLWDNPAKAQTIAKQIKRLQEKLETYDNIHSATEDVRVLLELAEAEEDESVIPEIRENIKSIRSSVLDLEFQTLFSGEHDPNFAILTINSGAGGTESCDWAQMLMRMYLRWAQDKGFKTNIVDSLPGEEAGIKNAMIIVEGDYAYGYLKAEIGVHRLVRISPFDSNKRRHTSFASIYVIPQIDDAIEVEIKPDELRIDTYHASGAGGQHVNVTDSAVRITHIPTGIVVQCQNERSQHKNKAQAMKILRSRLYEHYKAEQEAERAKKEQEKMSIAWGSQIRSYVFHPYIMVKDHRTNLDVGNGQAVMDGNLDPFIFEFLKMSVSGKNK